MYFKYCPSPTEAMVDPSLPIYRCCQHFLARYSDVFDTETRHLDQATVVMHRVDTGTEQPVHQRPYRTRSTERRAVQGDVDKMLGENIIQPSCIPGLHPSFWYRRKMAHGVVLIKHTRTERRAPHDLSVCG